MESINVKINPDTMESKLEKVLDSIAKRNNEFKTAKTDKSAYISDDSWKAYDKLWNDEPESAYNLFRKVIFNKAFSTVRKYRNMILKNNEITTADYRFVDNLHYTMENLEHVIAVSYIMVNDYARKKYPDSVHHAIRCACMNAIDTCKRKDFQNAIAIEQTITEDNETVYIIDTMNERKKDYEYDTSEKAIFNVTIEKMESIDKAIVTDYMNGSTMEQIGKRLFHYWNITEREYSKVAIQKRIKALQKYFR